LRDVRPTDVQLRVSAPGRGEPPPPAPPLEQAAWWARWALGMPSEIGEVACLLGEGERTLYYSPLPELW
jgi:hypothetical protein